MNNLNKNTEELFKLIKENPTLPVVPMVEFEVVGEDYGRWMGSWGQAYIDRYLIPKNSKNAIIFENEYTVSETLERYLTYDELDELPDDDRVWQDMYDKLPWIKAIIVRIDLPDESFEY